MATAKTAAASKTAAPAAEPSTALVVDPKAREKNALATLSEEMVAQMVADAEEGNNIGRDDLAIPFLRIAQTNTPQATPRHAKQVEGLLPSMFFNTSTLEFYSGEQGLAVIPVYFTQSYTEWVPRPENGQPAQGTGFVADHGATSPVPPSALTKSPKGKDLLPNGNELVRAGLYYLAIVDIESGEILANVAFPLSSTQLKKARGWNALINNNRVTLPGGRSIVPKMYYNVYILTTVAESNGKGNWFGVKVERGPATITLPNGNDLYLACKAMEQSIAGGTIKTASMENMNGDVAPAAPGVTGADEGDDEDQPF